MIRLLVSMVAAGAVAAAVDGDRTAKTLAFLLALLAAYLAPAFVRWLLAPSADAYGPRIDDDAAFSAHLAKIRKIDRNRAARYRSLWNLRTKVKGALSAESERTGTDRMNAAAALLDEIVIEHRMAPWTRWRLRRAFARDAAVFDRTKYARWALGHLERARGGSPRTRELARAAARDVLERGLRDPRADHGPLRALLAEHELAADDPKGDPAESPAAAEPAAAAEPERAPAPVAPPAPGTPAVAPLRWISPYEEVEIAGVLLPDGMVWRGPSDPAGEPSALDPELAVQAPRSDRRSDPQDAAYRDWTPTQRGAYLTWLAEGRRDADAPKAYARLWLDGVERRLVGDAAAGRVTRSEVEVLVRELLALAERQARRSTIAGSARSLADWATLRFGVELDDRTESRMTLALALARAYATGRPPTAGLAWSWVTAARKPTRVAWRRAPDEVRAWFELRYAEEPLPHTALVASGEHLTARHESSNLSLDRRVVEIADPLPAVDTDAVPDRLTELLDRACDELEPYARALGDPPRRPDLAVLAALPVEILARSEPHALVGLRSQLSVALCDRDVALFDARELFGEFRGTQANTRAFARICDALGHGFEPDPRFGGKPLRPDTRIAVFWAAEGAPLESTPAVSLARAVLELAVGVCAADGRVDADEHARLRELCDDDLGLTEADGPRMAAFAARLLDRPPRRPQLRKGSIPAADRARIAGLLVRIATTRGTPEPSVVRVLERIYAVLERDPDALHADLHAALHPAGAGSPRADAPPEGLDRERLRSKRAETAAVASLLREVFAGDEPSADAPAPAEPPAAEPVPGDPPGDDRGPDERLVAGLDAAHSAFALALAEHGEIARADVEALARRLGLFADGALDVLNDRAFELYDAPFWEGDDPLEIDADTAREMTR